MTSKSAGQIAYEARFPHAGGRHGEKLWKEQSRDVHELWDRIAEAVRLRIIEPVPGWRESGAEDPHGTRYNCSRDQLCGGHLTDDQVAFAVAMASPRDLGLEGVLMAARDRIRWLSRVNHYLEDSVRRLTKRAISAEEFGERIEALYNATKASLEASVRDANGMREELALRASRITSLEFELGIAKKVAERSHEALQQEISRHEQAEAELENALRDALARRSLPPIGLPPGTLQAYSDAYKAARTGPNHLDAHIAGLRGAIVHAAELIMASPPAPTERPEIAPHFPVKGRPEHFLAEAERICRMETVLGIYTAPEWEELSEDGQLWVAAIVQQTTADVSAETIAILRKAAPFVDWCCGEGLEPGWNGGTADPYPVHDEMARILGVKTLHDLQDAEHLEPACIACDLVLKDGDVVLNDASGGIIHVACCGPEREAYTGADGEPLKDGEPIPAGYVWKAEPETPEPAGTPYTVIGTTYDGVNILAPVSLPDNFTREEIRDVITLIRGPRSADMAAVVDAMTQNRMEVL